MKPVIVLTTVGADFNARAIATNLIERRLAACVNIIERVVSIYRWEAKVTEDTEQLLVIKTTAERISELRDALFAQHPYEVPEFVVVPIEQLSESYRAWLVNAVIKE